MQQTLPNFLVKRAFLTPNREALVFEQKRYTFSDVYERARVRAGQLASCGVKAGETLAVLLKNDAETIFLLYSFHLLNVKAVLLNDRLTARELSWQLNDANVTTLITERAFLETVTKLKAEWQGGRLLMKEDVIQKKAIDVAVASEIDVEDVCTIMYTSGTTGHPKGVLQTYGNHWWSAVGAALNVGLSERDGWLLALPLYHISGYSILMRSLIYGMKVVLLRSFDERAALETIRRENVTMMSVVSTMLARMIEAMKDETLPPSFRCMLLGGGTASESLLKACQEKRIPVYQTYGMTETASQIVTIAPEDALRKLGSCGKPLFPAQLKIVDDAGNEVAANVAGEIVVKGPNVTKGYLHRDDATKRAIRDGWLYTGDIGYVDEEGFLYVLDRRSDLIISGGENVYPAEVENILLSHPSVRDAGVVGMKDDTWGEVPVAFIVGDEAERESIRAFCEERLAKFKVPKRFIFIDAIPRTASKKIKRRALREKLEREVDKS